MHRRVKVLLYGQVVGELSQNDSGFLFQYAPDYHGPANLNQPARRTASVSQ